MKEKTNTAFRWMIVGVCARCNTAGGRRRRLTVLGSVDISDYNAGRSDHRCFYLGYH